MNPKSNDTRPFKKVIQTRKTKHVLCFIEEKKNEFKTYGKGRHPFCTHNGPLGNFDTLII